MYLRAKLVTKMVNLIVIRYKIKTIMMNRRSRLRLKSKSLSKIRTYRYQMNFKCKEINTKTMLISNKLPKITRMTIKTTLR